MQPLPLRSARIPPFHAVPVRQRSDDWTPLRQAEFIGHLAETGCVREAARRVGMQRETAYRLRTRRGAESFAAAWDAAVARGRNRAAPLTASSSIARDRARPHRKVTLCELAWRVETGIWRVRLRAGRYSGVSRKADNSALLTLLARCSRGASRLANPPR
ncbi:hypothetical protein [Altererythrobacter lutimaris]|uniref:Helix-turn-helix domain-containing protein n=1 Tax=Altererythrobacter lutimaris TaxID=2743979 RepID=A0A850H6N6_9SPHN|nr:hypothetical protein [Altererythrobacter lutimaris]NVE94914.1 hypothetical protein [Altererythrobacter lutimaris]